MTSTPVNADPEKGGEGICLSFADSAGHQSPSGIGSPHHSTHHHKHLSHARERLRHFVHPDGRKIHVASSPEEAIRLKSKLAEVHREDEFDICISGTPEHLDHLRNAQEHHEDRREELRTQHPEAFERFAAVYEELEALSHELDRVTTHGVSLEAHFSKYGYGAHIRSYDDEHSPSESGANTPKSRSGSSSSGSGKSNELACERGYATPLKLFKVPVVRQYFHKGVLWRASSAEEVQSFELFVDLLYVGILSVIGDQTSEDATAFSLLQFVITFTLSWKIWNDMTMLISWFETDDIFQRISILFLLACLFGFTTNITRDFEGTWPTLIGFYLCARLFMGCYLVIICFLVPMVRPISIWYIVLILWGASMWISSIHVSYPDRLALIWIGLFVDILGQMVFLSVQTHAHMISARFAAWWERTFEFCPAVNIEHRTERMNAFVTMVFGYTVVALLYQSTKNGIDAHYGKAVMGLTQCFCFNWMYFEIDGSNLHVHAIRRKKYTALIWNMSHLLFIMAFVLAGGALARLVLAIDTPDSNIDGLTPSYRAKAEDEISNGIRWFYCAGMGLALICMGFISLSHVHKEMPGLRLKKRKRLAGRFAVAIVLICLPLVKSLDSLSLVGTVTGLVVFVLVLELWAVSNCNECLWTRTKPCAYTGHFGKKDLVALIKHGKEFDVHSLRANSRMGSGLQYALS